VKIAKQKNVVFCLAHAACGGAPGFLARRARTLLYPYF
jgi:hypothetical protein